MDAVVPAASTSAPAQRLGQIPATRVQMRKVQMRKVSGSEDVVMPTTAAQALTGKLAPVADPQLLRKARLSQRLCASAIVVKELVAVGKAQLLHQRQHWSLSDGHWTGSSTQCEGEERGDEGCMEMLSPDYILKTRTCK